MATAAGGQLVQTLLYAVTILVFGLVAIGTAISARTALEAMAAFLAGFMVLRLAAVPVQVSAVVPFLLAIAVFGVRLRMTDRTDPRLFGRGIGRLVIGLLSAASVAAGLFILVQVVTGVGIGTLLTEYGTARTAAILLLESGPLLIGALGLGLLYRANAVAPRSDHEAGPDDMFPVDRQLDSVTAGQDGTAAQERSADDDEDGEADGVGVPGDQSEGAAGADEEAGRDAVPSDGG